jgi:hypothetical protein
MKAERGAMVRVPDARFHDLDAGRAGAGLGLPRHWNV